MTQTPLRLLLIEDSDDDALLVSTALESHGYEIKSKRISTLDGFREALGESEFEMILCDHAMPSFDVFEILEILRESGTDIPLIIVCDVTGEALAVKAMRCGAADYLLKDNLVRLGAAVEREVRDARIRHEKRIADEVLRASKLSYLAQRNALIALTRETQSEIFHTKEAFLRITETTARTLEVDRVSIWRFTENHEGIECLDLYELAADRHSDGLILNASDYPSYFEAIETMELIATDDALNDPITKEFSKNYLQPLGISSMLDVPICLGNHVNYLLCCEHIGPERQWTPDEKTFAVAVANLISLSLEIRGRTLARQGLARSHRALQMLSSCNEMLFRASDEKSLLEEACRIAVEVGGFRMAWVGYAMENDPQRIMPMAHAGDDLGTALAESQVCCTGDTPYCSALSDGKECDVPGRLESPRKCRYPSDVRFPLLSGGRVLGAFCVNGAGADQVEANEIEVLREMASHLSFGIETIRSRNARQKADARIREQASLIDKASDAILVRDLDHTITFWNKSAERLYGWTAEEAIGRSVVDLLYVEKSGFFKAHEQTLLSGEWAGELSQIDKSGRELIIEGRWSLVTDDCGRPQSVLAINTDISEYRRLERQFIRAQRMESIGTLAGGIAHDLNNILTPISVAVDLLKMREPEESSREVLEMIASSAKRGANMVGRVLSFARGEEGRHVRLRPQMIISEIESILRDTFPRNIEFEIKVDRDLWSIDGDPTQIHQVLLNLCVNASDAITGGGKISIGAENVHLSASFAAANLEATEGPYVCIRVQDTGEGVPTDAMERIFDPFFTTKTVGKGSGLGLPTSLAIVKSHGGFIRITSKPGVGTRARVYFPAHPEMDDKEPPAPISVELPRGAGETILVVDDETAILQIACHTLEDFGYRTLAETNGSEALVLYTERKSEIDVVFADLKMPVMDGSEMIERILEINPAAKIIVTSGISPNPDDAQSAIDSVSQFLPKPYTAETLLQCVRKTLGDDKISLKKQP